MDLTESIEANFMEIGRVDFESTSGLHLMWYLFI